MVTLTASLSYPPSQPTHMDGFHQTSHTTSIVRVCMHICCQYVPKDENDQIGQGLSFVLKGAMCHCFNLIFIHRFGFERLHLLYNKVAAK